MKKTRIANKRELVWLSAAVVLVFALWLLIGYLFPQEEQEQLYITSLTADEVTEVQWTFGEDTTELIKKDDAWASKTDEHFRVDQEKMTELLTAVCHFPVSQKLAERAESGEDYGTAQPRCMIRLTRMDNTAVEVGIGSYNAGLAEYYVWTNQSEDLYLADRASAEALLLRSIDFAAAPDYSNLYLDMIGQITVGGAESSFLLKPYDADTKMLYTDAFEWELDGYYDVPAGAEMNRIYELISMVKHVPDGARECYADSLTDYTQYGLDVPFASVAMDYEGLSWDGKKTKEKMVLNIGLVGDAAYGQYEGNSIIYRMDQDKVENLRILAAGESYLSKKICMMDPYTVEKMEIHVGAKSYDILTKREIVSNTDGSQAEALRWMANGTDADSGVIQKLYGALNELEFAQLAEGTVDVEPEMTIRFQRDTAGWSDMTMTVTPYDQSFCCVSFGTTDNYLINKLFVSNISNLLKEL